MGDGSGVAEDELHPSSDGVADTSGRGNHPATREALRRNAFKPGETGNREGVNGWRRAQSLIAAFLDEPAEAGKPQTRFQNVLMAAYQTALIPGIKGAGDRKLLVEQKAGKAKQQVELSGQDGAPLRVVAYLPDNGRGPDDPDPDDGEPSDSSK